MEFVLIILISSLHLQIVTSVSIEARKVAEANANFTRSIYEIIKDDNQFAVFSPFALTMALVALVAGARGDTEEKLKLGLKFQGIERHVLQTGISDILAVMQDNPGMNVRFISNLKLWIPKEIAVLNNYRVLINKRFNNASISILNVTNPFETEEFANSTSRVGVISSHSDFRGPWKKKFGYFSTRPGLFFLNANDRVPVEMMNHDDYFNHANLPELDAEALMLPLEGDRFGFILVLPNTRTGLASVESNLKRHPLTLIPRKLNRKWIELWIPKFRLNSTIQFVQSGILAKLKMSGITYPGADFGGISCGGDLYFTDLTQRTLIEVNEEGVGGGLRPSVPRHGKLPLKTNQTTFFNAEHPFLFFIYDYLTKSILIIGRKVN